MLQPKYDWKVLLSNETDAQMLSELLEIHPFLAKLLVSRGMKTANEANAFLNGSVEDMHDPYLLSGMKEAVPRIMQALEYDERILIYGDYDADGVSSTTLMIQLMRRLGANFEYYIPHRSKEGYGLHIHALEEAHKRGVTLVITVDTGISAVDQIVYANNAGMDVIVTDHHEPPDFLPEAYALINPKLPYCQYPFKGLAGVGVAYKLATALLGPDVPEAWSELAALGTIADLMPLVGENRMIVRTGLKSMSQSPFPGMTALLKVAGWNKGEVSSTQVAFGLAPRINASGRMSHANKAVALLTAESSEQADMAAHELDLLNKERQSLVENIVGEAMDMLEDKEASGNLPDVIVVAGEGWNVGVVGIVASKILERYYRPTLVLGIDSDTGQCKGSARSIPGFDIYEALNHCSSLLEHFGGHPSAAGMSLHRDQLEQFDQRLNAFASGLLLPEHLIPTMTADLECSLQEITLPIIEQLEGLAPFGMDNPSPRLLIRGAKLLELRQMGKDGKHLKLTLEQHGKMIEALAFGKGEIAYLLSKDAMVDIIAEPGINEWNGSRKAQLFIQDISIPQLQVFDYRGSRHPESAIQDILEHLLKLPNCQANSMAVVLNDGSDDMYNFKLKDTSLWVYDRRVGVLPKSDGLENAAAHHIRTLFVMELPKLPVIWNTILTLFTSLERVFLMHPMSTSDDVIEIPSRDHFKQIYALLRRLAVASIAEDELVQALKARTSLSRRMLAMTLDVFEELDFIERASGIITVNNAPSKRPLDSSSKYKELGWLAEMEQMMLHSRASQITEWMLAQIQEVS
ncbi:single-stranded-DNA-specific exonuclease [Fontibacillus solani]|uniref:Single-stranded-DNA-specific exonuclease RecJ n=1 Tax=Fontibacillus solani TaxID=1572857 RepID=A0A7W3SXY3_9BACL|nr:single-stranded-DNA-specific exonuclease [Fontibacillus solani]